jgi:hypothetical protein
MSYEEVARIFEGLCDTSALERAGSASVGRGRAGSALLENDKGGICIVVVFENGKVVGKNSHEPIPTDWFHELLRRVRR